MNPLARTRHQRRPRWVASGFFWGVLVLADLAILSLWVTLGTLVLGAFFAGGFVWRRRRLLAAGVAAGGAPVVLSPAGTPLEAPPAGLVPPPAPGGDPAAPA
ncbi:hypothetical protein [Cryptosporangium japonicum]|uniref:Uncharacterized protein n=1 Tax=Cryptosporangium japonicum TaxID=80872 RepID=A0ABP3EXM0_9ACTN